MNDFLFYALIIALLYYFFFYLPKNKSVEPTKLTHSQFTQTNPSPITQSENTAELEPLLDQLIKSIQQLNHQIK